MSVPPPEQLFRDTVGDLLDSPPQMLLDVRFAEQEARRIAEDQVLMELFSNARDAALRGGRRFMTVAAERAAGQAPAPPARVWVRIERDALVVANDGAPFDASAYRSVRRIARSSKRSGPTTDGLGSGKGIALTMGRHGVGFRSVLALSERPQIHGRGPDGTPFGLEFGAPRLRAFAEAAANGDQEGCLAALGPGERGWLEDLLAAPLGLPARSLVRHAARWEISGSALAEGLPVLPFPLALSPEEVPAVVRELLHLPPPGSAVLGGSKEPAALNEASGVGDSPAVVESPQAASSVDRPYATVVYLPLDPPLSAEKLAQVRGQQQSAQRCFLGTRIRLQR